MQLHVCLLLLISTADATSASSPRRCGGDVSLGREPAGRVSLTLPGPVAGPGRPHSADRPSDGSLPLCTWMMEVPPGRTLLLKVERGSSLSVRCARREGDPDRALESGRTALLSGCDGNKAALTWTGAGRSSNALRLSYYVQEDERNSSEDHTGPQSQTGTSSTSTAPLSHKSVRGTQGGVRGRLHEGPERSRRLRSELGPSSGDKGLPHPTSPLQGLGVAGRGTLPLPEEGPHNGADTSGPARRTDGRVSATHPYFQHTNSDGPPPTLMPLTAATARGSRALLGTGTRARATQRAGRRTTAQAHPSPSASGAPSPASSSLPTRETATVPIPRAGAVSGTPGENGSHSWRSQRSAERLDSEHLTSAVTSDPSQTATEPLQGDCSSARTDSEPAESSPFSQEQGNARMSSSAHVTELDAAVGTAAAASFHPDRSRTGSPESAASAVSAQTAAFEPSRGSGSTAELRAPASSSRPRTSSPRGTESPARSPHAASALGTTEATRRHLVDADVSAHTIRPSPAVAEVEDRTSSSARSSSAPSAALTSADENSRSTAETHSLLPTRSPTGSAAPPSPSSTSPRRSAAPHTPHRARSSPTPASAHAAHAATSATPVSEPTAPAASADDHTAPTSSRAPTIQPTSSRAPTIQPTSSRAPTIQPTSSRAPTIQLTSSRAPLPSPAIVPATHGQTQNYVTTTTTTTTTTGTSLSSTTTGTSLSSVTAAKSDDGHREVDEDESWQHTPTATPPLQPPWTTPHPSRESRVAPTPSAPTAAPARSSTASQTPRFYIVPDQPATVKVESIELLLQIIVEESGSALGAGLEEDTAAWMEPYLQKAPGFGRLQGVWSSGHAVQSLVEFKTSGALQWLSAAGPSSLLEMTGLAQAVRQGKTFRSSKISNITLGGLQGDVCDWLLQCPAGYKCVSQSGAANYNCSSVCRFDYCHHHGICTHHPGQLPVCRCLVGEDFWYMGQRCDVRMTRARLVGACLAVLLVMVTVVAALAFVAVRRYRAILIQAKVDQTRSSYRRFNHFDELSGRFWLRSWAGSADSMDNPAFTRSDELLHLRALDRPCCYHDDTLSLASTSPSHGTHINTIYPHSSQYGWRGSGMSVGDGVLDSGKASDLSVCSWPVEPIHWTPFPLLQQLASNRTPTVRVSRPRSYCEGMELVDLGKSWTA
ncbi:mucin-5AC isoform X2 [Scophthalmus maximus]|uniref:mucin-5AC isoform X2 n=1 Tax=Scophthalmus maximus TaxID=52904 RepID=UPI001FA89B93|nr:mucin-5AC isoform X2 [Scophthalmus maximus]